ncbi:MAG: hypothetical protein MRJ68_06090 [Nitrospira sp.]|nr:hypothetical protein [Nitrospira sp.]
MTLSAEWLALQREAQLAAEQIATGVTILGRANHAQTGLYSQAFFGLSIGLERIGKLIVVANHAIQNNGNFPTDSDLRKIGHELRKLLSTCDLIGKAIKPEGAYTSRPADHIHRGIEETLSEFATRSRYYNLAYIAGGAGGQSDPIGTWWENVAKPICDRHYPESQRRKDEAQAAFMGKLLDRHSMVIHHTEEGAEINDLGTFFARAGVTVVVQKYGRLYMLQIVRWLSSIITELSRRGAYEKRIEPLLGLDEPFWIFRGDDRSLLKRKTWSIYRM